MLTDFHGKISPTLITVWALSLVAGISGCATGRSKADRDELNAMRGQLSEMRGLFTSLTTRLEAVEGKLNTLTAGVAPTDRVASTNASASPVQPHPGEGSGITPLESPSAKDPDGAFINDDAVQDFRKTMLQFRAGLYAESAAGFTSFLEKYPDHPLAGSAGYLVGRSYFKLRNYAQAIEEYDRVLTTYDRSSHVAATLRDLADAEEALKHVDDAARHRQLLASLFPHSPESERPREVSDVPMSSPPAGSKPAVSPTLDGPPPTVPGPDASIPKASSETGPSASPPSETATVRMENIPAPHPAEKPAGSSPPPSLDGVPSAAAKE